MACDFRSPQDAYTRVGLVSNLSDGMLRKLARTGPFGLYYGLFAGEFKIVTQGGEDMANYYRARRRRRFSRGALLLWAAGALAVGTWWGFLRDSASELVEGTLALAPKPKLTTDRPESTSQTAMPSNILEKGKAAQPQVVTAPSSQVKAQASALVQAGKDALARGELIDARSYLSEALQLGLDDTESTLVRAELTRLGNETILSRRVHKNDPLVSSYIIKTGDTLGKIAKAHKISPELIASINGIENKHLIRAGQNLKVIHGPFHALIRKSEYSLDILLDNTIVKHFSVGLGADDSTPSGKWQVGTKLVNPTYYPPRGGKIISADDPQNPLGERWIGLVGIAGDAVGQARYGIHGTIEPESIGRSVSLGCIRMHNQDVESVYTYLIERVSTVIVAD